MNNIFDVLPLNFFNIFFKNKTVMSDCLFVLYDYMKEDTAFASLKENIIFELTKYFNNHIVEIEDMESHQAKDKAYYVYRRFKECGWIVEEMGNNYQTYASFEDYAINILEALKNQGLRIMSGKHGEFTVKPKAYSWEEYSDTPDVIFICVIIHRTQ